MFFLSVLRIFCKCEIYVNYLSISSSFRTQILQYLNLLAILFSRIPLSYFSLLFTSMEGSLIIVLIMCISIWMSIFKTFNDEAESVCEHKHCLLAPACPARPREAGYTAACLNNSFTNTINIPIRNTIRRGEKTEKFSFWKLEEVLTWLFAGTKYSSNRD